MATSDIDFVIQFDQFNEGFAPIAHLDTKTFVGNRGQASEMMADIISLPGYIKQSPSLANLTNGSQAGVVDQLIRHILDRPVSSTTTYAVGTSKLFKLSSTTVVSGGSPSWPQTITDMTEGESVIRLKENVFVFYNKASGGDIAAMPIATEVIDPDWGSTTDAALEKAPHPSAAKEDIILFGNGRYCGAFIYGSPGTLDTKKLDFGEGAEVADVAFHANSWWIAVNYGEGKRSQIYMYDGSAMSNILSDETGLGDQQIGFLYVLNGNIFVAVDDKSDDCFSIGWLSGRSIKPLRYFSGSLPNHRQKALFKNTILFVSDDSIWSSGAPVEQLPLQISKLATGGLATVGAIASPFGVPLVASSDTTPETPLYQLAKFSGYSTDSFWHSIFIDTTSNRLLGKINTIIVATKPLEAGAAAEIVLEGNQGASTSSAFSITGTNKTRHVFRTVDLGAVEDVRLKIDFGDGSITKTCPIRKIILLGNFVER
jgi:hypothetical protein